MRKKSMSTRSRSRTLTILLEKPTITEMLKLRALCNIKPTSRKWSAKSPTSRAPTIKTRLSGKANANSSKTKRKTTKKTCRNPNASSKSPWNSCKKEDLAPRTSMNSTKTPLLKTLKTNIKIKLKKC